MTTTTHDRPAPAEDRTSPLRTAVRRTGARCAVLFLVATVSTALSLALPLALGQALDVLLAHPDGGGAMRQVLWCAGIILLLAVLDAVETVLSGTTNARATAWLRHRLTGHLLAVGPRAGERFGSGELVARLVGNAAQAGTAPAALAALLAALAGPVGAVVALGLLDPWLALVFLAGAPLLALLLRTFTQDSSRCVADYQEAQGRIASGLAEAIGGSRTIAACGTADREVARVLRPLPDLARAGRRMWHVQGRAAARAIVLAPLLQLGVVAVAGVLLVRGRLTVGEMLAASRYAVLAAGVGVLVGQLSGLVRARASARRLGEVLAEPVMPYGNRRTPPGRGRLELRGVTARRGGRTLLDGVDLVVPGGTTLAVVGRSGAGKSLLAALAGRLADPDEGTVILDGVPLPELDHDELRRAIGYAFERPALLGDTIADTIAFGVRAAPPDRIRAGAAAARADTFVRRMPDGYATLCQDAPLSGGERQRLGLARVLARDSRLLVLDDALSSLDTVTEHQVVDALLRHSPAGTRVIVAHRVSTAARADTVAWLDGGRVRAVGTHARLWRDRSYREVFAHAEG
jgi:ATP-binding cassette subfamily B protein